MIVGVALAAAVAFAFWYRPQAPPPVTSNIPAAPSPSVVASTPALLTVHVSGAVADPGLVAVPEGSRVADAVARAGGVKPGAALGSINLAAPVVDGMHLVVPWTDSAQPTGIASLGESTPSPPVDLNRAGVGELTAIPGLGEVLATRIVDHRQAHGPFNTMEDLLDVPGIGEGRLAGLRDYATVGR